MDARELAPGLWRWTAPHPDWEADAEPDSPADWERDVGCVLYETPAAAVFVDPLVPEDADAFWSWSDERVAGRPVRVLTTVRWHRRSRAAFVARYGASLSRARGGLPEGVEAFALAGADETVFWLPDPRALVPGDRLLGARGGGLRVCPDSWLSYLPNPIGVDGLKAALRPLLDLPIERVLVSHGEPLLADGHAALARALDG